MQMRLSIVTTLSVLAQGQVPIFGLDGEPAAQSEFPFAVALMRCSGDPLKDGKCTFHCSGALVATNAVVTAGHCLEEPQIFSDAPAAPRVPIGELYVLAGTANHDNISSGTLVKAASFVNKGFGKNFRFRNDNDVGIVFLDECLTLMPGVIETIPVASDSSATAPGVSLTTLGMKHGKDSGTSGIQPVVHDVHSRTTCVELYVLSQTRGDTRDKHALLSSLELLMPPEYMCASGVSGSCSGDTGTPAFVTKSDGSRVLASVGLVGTASGANLCKGPCFSHKLAGKTAAWIAEELEKHPACSSLETSFDQWPLPALDGPRDLRRCPVGMWQCASGGCVRESFLCDGSKACSDGSDEAYCRSPIAAKTTTKRALRRRNRTGVINGAAATLPASNDAPAAAGRAVRALVDPHIALSRSECVAIGKEVNRIAATVRNCSPPGATNSAGCTEFRECDVTQVKDFISSSICGFVESCLRGTDAYDELLTRLTDGMNGDCAVVKVAAGMLMPTQRTVSSTTARRDPATVSSSAVSTFAINAVADTTSTIHEVLRETTTRELMQLLLTSTGEITPITDMGGTIVASTSLDKRTPIDWLDRIPDIETHTFGNKEASAISVTNSLDPLVRESLIERLLEWDIYSVVGAIGAIILILLLFV